MICARIRVDQRGVGVSDDIDDAVTSDRALEILSKRFLPNGATDGKSNELFRGFQPPDSFLRHHSPVHGEMEVEGQLEFVGQMRL